MMGIYCYLVRYVFHALNQETELRLNQETELLTSNIFELSLIMLREQIVKGLPHHLPTILANIGFSLIFSR